MLRMQTLKWAKRTSEAVFETINHNKVLCPSSEQNFKSLQEYFYCVSSADKNISWGKVTVKHCRQGKLPAGNSGVQIRSNNPAEHRKPGSGGFLEGLIKTKGHFLVRRCWVRVWGLLTKLRCLLAAWEPVMIHRWSPQNPTTPDLQPTPPPPTPKSTHWSQSSLLKANAAEPETKATVSFPKIKAFTQNQEQKVLLFHMTLMHPH